MTGITPSRRKALERRTCTLFDLSIHGVLMDEPWYWEMIRVVDRHVGNVLAMLVPDTKRPLDPDVQVTLRKAYDVDDRAREAPIDLAYVGMPLYRMPSKKKLEKAPAAAKPRLAALSHAMVHARRAQQEIWKIWETGCVHALQKELDEMNVVGGQFSIMDDLAEPLRTLKIIRNIGDRVMPHLVSEAVTMQREPSTVQLSKLAREVVTRGMEKARPMLTD